MRVRSIIRSLHVGALSGAIALGACSEPTTPRISHGISASRSSARATSTDASLLGSTSPTFIRFAAGAPPLETYDTSFVVTVGKLSGFYICFANTTTTFLYVTIPKDAQFFDAAGNPLPRGDTVRISVQIDPVYASIQFGPHGSLFLGARGPALLQVNYDFLDFGGRAPTDTHILYQPESGSTWTTLATQVDVDKKWLVASIYHFSNYAVAF
jgi:hypothetical protein